MLRRTAVLVAGMLVLLAGLVGCRQTPTPEQEEFVYGLTLAPSGIDPHVHASSELGIPLRSVYDTLVYRDAETGEFVPGLASEWNVSEDGLTYTFTLRQDVTFHDGTRFDAEAVKANLERVLDPATASQKAVFLLGPVARVDVLGEYQVAIVLSKPFEPLLDGLSQVYLGIASPSALAEWDTATYQFHQVGTGPYRFVEYIPDDRLVLERNPDYNWAPSVVANQGPPAIERITFRFFEDPATRSLALEGGEAMVVGELLPTDARDLTLRAKANLLSVPIPGQPLQFILNTQREPTSSRAVRQALIMATDRQAISQAVFQGYSPVANGPLSAVTLGYDPALEGRYPYDPVQAEALFNTTGLTDTDGDGWRDVDGEPVVLKVIVPPWGQTPEVSQLVEAQWEEALKVQVEVQQVASFVALSEAAASGDYHAISLNFFGLDPTVLDNFYLSTGRLNWSKVADPELDAWLVEAQSARNPAVRVELYKRIQGRIMDEALIVPIRDYVNLVGMRPNVEGLHFDAQGWFPYLTDLGLAGPGE
jgi:peptide/nickel transport system substrate-binding protein